MANNYVDILSINETKLEEDTYDNEAHIPGYEMIRRYRITNGVGGVSFYATNSGNFIIRNNLYMNALKTSAWKFEGSDQNRL